jgi:hypothetical protein
MSERECERSFAHGAVADAAEVAGGDAPPLRHRGAQSLPKWPTKFWRKPENPLRIERSIAEAERRRQLEKEVDEAFNQFGSEGLGPVRRP